jgi:hypothetical protein
MNLPFSGNSISESARHYVERIGSLYNKAKARIGRAPHDRDALQNWQWHRASAQACLEEAVLIYLEGLEALLQAPVTVELGGETGAPMFICHVGAGGELVFRLGAAEAAAAVLAHDDERSAVEALFGKADRELLEVLAEGLSQLRWLGEFEQRGRIKLTPELDAAVGEAITAPAG